MLAEEPEEEVSEMTHTLGKGDVGFLKAQGDGIGEALELALRHLLDGDLDKVAWRLGIAETRLWMLQHMLESYEVVLALDGRDPLGSSRA